MTPAEQTERFFKWSHPEGQVRELRVFSNFHGRPQITSGWYDNTPAICRDVEAVDREPETTAVYVTVNSVRSDIRHASEMNRILPPGTATSAADIEHFSFLLLDIDPERPAGESATEDEQLAAKSRAYDIRECLADQGLPRPALICSGNGYYLLYAVNLPASDAGLIKAVTQGLSLRFSDSLVKLDDAVHNPDRIMRVPGTWNRKGPGTAERPHRLCEVIELPERREVTREQLLSLIETFPKPTEAKERPLSVGGSVSPADGELRPGDDFNARGDDLGEMLESAGWKLFQSTAGERTWTRPGKETGPSAKENEAGLYVFSSNASPFEGSEQYSRFAVYAKLFHGGDFTAATKALAARGFGSRLQAEATDVDVSKLVNGPEPKKSAEPPVLPLDPPDPTDRKSVV